MNAYRGGAPIDIGGKTFLVRYPWDAIVRLKAEIGDDFDSKIVQASINVDMDVLAKALAVGIDDPEVTVDYIREQSPPIIAASNAVHEALVLAFHGPEGPSAKKDENPQKARPRTSSPTRKSQPSGRASSRKNSGA